MSGKFTHTDAGQMDLFLNYAHIHRMHEDENPPAGLIVYSRKDETVARYAFVG
ncbi:MAG: PDDEXK nuclease domain-containing protein [Gemmatimonadota bacterium]|nr:PDDEXK nuclease domain-containing protein [Gemmatimonadota bacterium]